MNLNQYLSLARRCACLSIAPASLPCVLSAFRKVKADLEKVYYWRKGGWGSSGLLLLQSASSVSLSNALRKLNAYPHHSLLFVEPVSYSIDHFNLPPYRVCSDPSIWSVDRKSSVSHIDSILQVEPEPLSSLSLEKQLLTQESVVGQMETLVNATSLTHPQRLLRLVFSDSLQEIVSSFRPGTTVYPFGSALNGLGSQTSDLDLVIRLGLDITPNLREVAQLYQQQQIVSSFPTNKALKVMEGFLRYTGQTSYHALPPIRHLLSQLDPMSGRRSRIFPGRIAIINYSRHQCLGVGVDICHDCGVGFHTAYLMRTFATQVPIFPFLAFTLKHVMRAANITQHGPTPGITSFKLTALLIHFLQVSGHAPPLEYLLEEEGQDNESISRRFFIPIEEKDVVCPEEAAEVLADFFVFLHAMKPDEMTICLLSGRTLPRGDECTSQDFVYCPDPVRPDNNITRGISRPVWDELMIVIDQMQSILSCQSKPDGKRDRPWGLPAMCKSCTTDQPSNYQLLSDQ